MEPLAVVVAWITAIGLLLALVMQFIQLGRFLQKLDGIRDDFNEFKETDFSEFKETVGIMDEHLGSLSRSFRELILEWQGHDGTNGGRSRIKNLEQWKESVEKRHYAEDAVTEIEKELGEGKRRRLRDRIIDMPPETE